MADEDRWAKVRQIVKEECEAIERRIMQALEKHGEAYKPARTSSIRFIEGCFWGISQEHKKAWQEAYPSVDVEVELKKAAAWILSNPREAPKSQLGKFLNTWFTRNQDRAAIRAIPGRLDLVPKGRVCAWCGAPSSGSTNGNEHCPIHAIKAMHEDPPPRKVA